jgi:hypothetical protein
MYKALANYYFTIGVKKIWNATPDITIAAFVNR